MQLQEISGALVSESSRSSSFREKIEERRREERKREGEVVVTQEHNCKDKIDLREKHGSGEALSCRNTVPYANGVASNSSFLETYLSNSRASRPTVVRPTFVFPGPGALQTF